MAAVVFSRIGSSRSTRHSLFCGALTAAGIPKAPSRGGGDGVRAARHAIRIERTCTSASRPFPGRTWTRLLHILRVVGWVRAEGVGVVWSGLNRELLPACCPHSSCRPLERLSAPIATERIDIAAATTTPAIGTGGVGGTGTGTGGLGARGHIGGPKVGRGGRIDGIPDATSDSNSGLTTRWGRPVSGRPRQALGCSSRFATAQGAPRPCGERRGRASASAATLTKARGSRGQFC
jgi:hypothetical protein